MWKRLPFGLKVSSEIFQCKIDEALNDLDGVFNIVDDVVIVGCSNSHAEAQSGNQQKLAVALKRCAGKNIFLNEDKQQTGLDEIIFHGHRITKDGLKVDEAKVQAIRDMPAPTDVEGVKRLCGMAQYMAKFLPNLAATLELIRPRTIVSRLRDWKERETILKFARKIKPDNIFVKEDLSPATLEKKESQRAKMEAAKRAGKIAYFVLDKLVIRDRPNVENS